MSTEEKPKKRGPGRPKGTKGKANSTSFKKGAGNPKGRPKADHTLRDALRAKGPEIAKTLIAFFMDESLSVEDRLKVFDRIAERGWGKVPVPMSDGEGNSAGVTIVLAGADADL